MRRFREAKALITRCDVDIVKFLKNKRNSFAGHVVRFGLNQKEPHTVKHILMWRTMAWWKEQQKYNLQLCDHGTFLNQTRFGKPRRWESQFPIDYFKTYRDGES